MPLAEPRSGIPATLDSFLRQLLREVVREEIPAIASAVLAAFRAEAVSPVTATNPSAPYVTVAKAAVHLGVSEKTVRRWIRDGKLRAVSAGRLIRVERSALESSVSNAGADASSATDVDAVAAQILAKRKR